MNQENLNYFKDIVDDNPALKLYMSPLSRARLPRHSVGLREPRPLRERHTGSGGTGLETVQGQLLHEQDRGTSQEIPEDRLRRLQREWDREEQDPRTIETDTGH